MKKLLILTAVAIISTTALGCSCGSRFWNRGCNTCESSGSVVGEPYVESGQTYVVPPSGATVVPGPTN